MAQLDCLLIHTPKFDNYYQPLGHHTWLNYMPIGLLGLADHLHKSGFKCRILHQGVEWLEDRHWKLEDRLADVQTPLYALTLHWHQQAFDVIETCRRLRAAKPDAFILLGGFTASFFHEELVRDWPCIDGVVRGDGEMPLLELAKHLRQDSRELSGVPNLTWRNAEGEVVTNELSYCGGKAVLDSLCFSNLEFLDNYRTYVDYITYPFYVLKYLSKESNFKAATDRKKLFPLMLGRGCPFNCTWCAGSFTSQRDHISGRQQIAWRSHDAVLRDIRGALDHGYEAMYSALDPQPHPAGQRYYIELFQRIKREGLRGKIGWRHEATGLTSRKFVDEFARTFADDYRTIAISPETGNEQVRRRNKGYFYSNPQLYEMLDYTTQQGIAVDVFLTYGIPGENETSLQDTIAMRQTMTQKYGGRVKPRALSIEIEPGAPWHVDPSRFGVVLSRKSFKDFYESHHRKGQSSYTNFGYYIPDFFEKPLSSGDPEGDFANRLQQIKCKHLCFAHPDLTKVSTPFWGRAVCRLTRVVRFLTMFGMEERISKWNR